MGNALQAAPGATSLVAKLVAVSEGLTTAERAAYKILLGMAAGGLAPSGSRPDADLGAASFDAVVAAMAAMQPHSRLIPEDGVVYRGRPDFVDDDLLTALRAELQQLRSTAFRFDDHYVVSDGPLARAVGESEALIGLIEACGHAVAPTARANYLFYDRPGLGIDPHVDDGAFSLNAILMLDHEFVARPSALVLYPVGAPPQRVLLSPGEMLVMYADSTTHARERMGDGERVSIVAFGFRPLGAGAAGADR